MVGLETPDHFVCDSAQRPIPAEMKLSQIVGCNNADVGLRLAKLDSRYLGAYCGHRQTELKSRDAT